MDYMKFYCQWVSVSVNSSKQFHTNHLHLDLGIELGLGQCDDAVSPNGVFTLTDTETYTETETETDKKGILPNNIDSRICLRL